MGLEIRVPVQDHVAEFVDEDVPIGVLVQGERLRAHLFHASPTYGSNVGQCFGPNFLSASVPTGDGGGPGGQFSTDPAVSAQGGTVPAGGISNTIGEAYYL